MDNHCCICGAYLTDTGRMICEKCEKPKKVMPKNTCQGCVYYKACGESTRTAPCYGRMTKRDRRAEDGK